MSNSFRRGPETDSVVLGAHRVCNTSWHAIGGPSADFLALQRLRCVEALYNTLDSHPSCVPLQPQDSRYYSSTAVNFMHDTGYLRSKKRAKAGAPATAAVLAKEERKRRGSGKKPRQLARQGAMTGTIEDGTQRPEQDYSTGRVEEM